MTENGRRRLVWWLLVAVFLALRVPALLHTAPTWDEPIYVGAGKHLLVNGDRRAAALRYHPPLAYHLTSLPIAVLNTPLADWDPEGASTQVGLPVLYDTTVPWEGSAVSAYTMLLLSRLPILLLGLLGMDLLRRLGTRLYDGRAGLVAAGAWALHPDFVAHGVLATTDLVAAVAAVFLAIVFVDYHDVSPKQSKTAGRRAVLLGVAIGLALMAKHTLLFSVAVVGAASVIWRWTRRRRGEDLCITPIGRALGTVAVAALVLWGGYLFEIRPIALSDVRPHGVSVALAEATGIDTKTFDDLAENVPVPAATYFQSVLDAVLVKARARDGTPWQAYLNGEWSAEGYWTYFPRAMAVKTPVVLLILMLGGLCGWWWLRRDRADVPDLCLALFAVPFAAAVFSRLNIGVRHLMPAVPFAMLLGAAGLSRLWDSRPRLAGWLLAILALGAVVDWVPNVGEPLAFANVASGGPDRLHRRLADSNLDVGQDLWALEEWAGSHAVTRLHCHLHLSPGLYDRERERHPVLMERDVALAREMAKRIRAENQTGDVPAEGLLAIGESEMLRPRFKHLAEIEPLARVGRIRIYRVTED